MDGWMDRENNDSNLRAGAQDFIFLPNFFGGGLLYLFDRRPWEIINSRICLLPANVCRVDFVTVGHTHT